MLHYSSECAPPLSSFTQWLTQFPTLIEVSFLIVWSGGWHPSARPSKAFIKLGVSSHPHRKCHIMAMSLIPPLLFTCRLNVWILYRMWQANSDYPVSFWRLELLLLILWEWFFEWDLLLFGISVENYNKSISWRTVSTTAWWAPDLNSNNCFYHNICKIYMNLHVGR